MEVVCVRYNENHNLLLNDKKEEEPVVKINRLLKMTQLHGLTLFCAEFIPEEIKLYLHLLPSLDTDNA